MTINQVITDRELADLKHRYRDNADFMRVLEALEYERGNRSRVEKLRLRIAELEEDLADSQRFI